MKGLSLWTHSNLETTQVADLSYSKDTPEMFPRITCGIDSLMLFSCSREKSQKITPYSFVHELEIANVGNMEDQHDQVNEESPLCSKVVSEISTQASELIEPRITN